ncbi:MAG: nuclear transport factor 2 family protein [Phycisphaeraceae bacterium]
MASETTDQFIDALHRLERERDVDAIAALFADDAELMNAARISVPRGEGGVRKFWRAYRQAFDDIHSQFTSVKEGEGFAVLEWHSEGMQRGGGPIRYDGVSVLELQGDRIKRFAIYYDSAAFLQAQQRRAG